MVKVCGRWYRWIDYLAGVCRIVGDICTTMLLHRGYDVRDRSAGDGRNQQMEPLSPLFCDCTIPT